MWSKVGRDMTNVIGQRHQVISEWRDGFFSFLANFSGFFFSIFHEEVPKKKVNILNQRETHSMKIKVNQYTNKIFQAEISSPTIIFQFSLNLFPILFNYYAFGSSPLN